MIDEKRMDDSEQINVEARGQSFFSHAMHEAFFIMAWSVSQLYIRLELIAAILTPLA